MKESNENNNVTNPMQGTAFKSEDDFVKSNTSTIGGNSERMSNLEIDDSNKPSDKIITIKKNEVPNMWSKDYIGLYAQYAAVGLLYGMSGSLKAFCFYVYHGAPNLCANGSSIMFFAWNLKIFYAIVTDSYRPFGMRRKPFMMTGWFLTLMMLLILSIVASSLDASTWLVMLLLTQISVMCSDVPADGYSVELGQLEPIEQRGQILATGQLIRFSFNMLAGLIQALLLNGPSTNPPDKGWNWGLTINQYYGFMFALTFILTIPIWFLKELDATNIPQHSVSHHIHQIWETLTTLTTLYLLIFVLGINIFTNFVMNVNIYVQYYLLELTNLQAGIDTIAQNISLVFAIYLFKTYLINRNWRWTQYGSTTFSLTIGLIWIAVYHDSGGTMNAWFTIFIDLDQYFAQGLSQVLYSMSVIELAKPGLEATTYELVITVANAASTVNGILSTQMLTPLDCAACNTTPCPTNTVDLTNTDTYYGSSGPFRFTKYNLTLTGISIAGVLIFTPFLPRSKQECKEWKEKGEQMGASNLRGYIALFLCIATVLYGVVIACLLLDTNTSCQPAVGGSGC